MSSNQRRYTPREEFIITEEMCLTLQRLQRYNVYGPKNYEHTYFVIFAGLWVLDPHDAYTHLVMTGRLLALRLWRSLEDLRCELVKEAN